MKTQSVSECRIGIEKIELKNNCPHGITINFIYPVFNVLTSGVLVDLVLTLLHTEGNDY